MPGVSSSQKGSWRKKRAEGRAALACIAAGWLYIHHQIKHLPSATGLCGLGETYRQAWGMVCLALVWAMKSAAFFADLALKLLTWGGGCWG